MKATDRKALNYIGEDNTVAITTNLCISVGLAAKQFTLIFVKCSVGGPRLGAPFLHGVTQGLGFLGVVIPPSFRARTSLPRASGAGEMKERAQLPLKNEGQELTPYTPTHSHA